MDGRTKEALEYLTPKLKKLGINWNKLKFWTASCERSLNIINYHNSTSVILIWLLFNTKNVPSGCVIKYIFDITVVYLCSKYYKYYVLSDS